MNNMFLGLETGNYLPNQTLRDFFYKMKNLKNHASEKNMLL